MQTHEFSGNAQISLRIAGVDRQKFNEAAAAGFLRWAPRVRGKTRTFDAVDLATAYVFGRLVDLGMTPRRAGRLAGDFGNAVRNGGAEWPDSLTLVRGTRGEFLTANYDPDTTYPGIGVAVLAVLIPLRNVWEQVLAPQAQYERAALEPGQWSTCGVRH